VEVNFTVAWDSDALREFHELWAVSPDPAAVRAARAAVEQSLAADPFGTGRHMSEGLWRAHVPPILFHYRIDPDRQLVEITDVQAPG
jgi:hypothetical protein